ncbi:carbohydrate ABC transporter permease [Cohnella abietis]|uniref:Putative ABC transporter permease protein YurM n=1 Tax=Cohnella abietis TaxID=2507935 RepID=A0A3T1CY05_9BACL|nr:carbohydrate ABC transporter permease [Cohnella abietis]BBI30714.1 putative ABC transporter permease protein YurM [Cohnella abietis]
MKTNRWLQFVVHFLLLGIGILWIFPFIWTLFSSLKSENEFFTSRVALLPEKAQWHNYARAWNVGQFSDYFGNTIVLTISVVIIVIVFCALTGYALGRVDFIGRKAFIGVIVATMFIPKGYTIIPVYLLIKSLGLLNSMPGLILVESSGAHTIFILLFTTYFSKIPKELEEAAEIDGCGFVRSFAQIMLPLSKPIIATVAIVQAIYTWNSFFTPLIFTLGKPSIRTLAVGMYNFADNLRPDYTGTAAGATIALIPILILFVLFQRYFIEGVSGSVKG